MVKLDFRVLTDIFPSCNIIEHNSGVLGLGIFTVGEILPSLFTYMKFQ